MPANPAPESHAPFELSLSVIDNDSARTHERGTSRQISSVRLNDRDSVLLLVALTARLQFWRNALSKAAGGDDVELYGAAAAYEADYERLVRTLTRGRLA